MTGLFVILAVLALAAGWWPVSLLCCVAMFAFEGYAGFVWTLAALVVAVAGCVAVLSTLSYGG